MPRLLLLPSVNTYTHLLECYSFGQQLSLLGHLVHYGISQNYCHWAEQHGLAYSLIPELWEQGPTDHPNVSWFIDHDYVTRCIYEEIKLMQRVNPHLVLADFKYTTGISARVAGIPLISLNIFSMLPRLGANFFYLDHDGLPES